MSRLLFCGKRIPQWRVPAEASLAKMWGSGGQRGGQRPTSWQSPQRHRRGTPSPSCPWARRAWLAGPSRGGRWAWDGLPGRPSASLPARPLAPVESGSRVPRPGVTRVAVIPAPVTSRARNSCSYQAEVQPRVGGLSQARPGVPQGRGRREKGRGSDHRAEQYLGKLPPECLQTGALCAPPVAQGRLKTTANHRPPPHRFQVET